MNNTDPRQMAVLLHLSQLLGYVVPVAGWGVPLAIWLTQKNTVPGIDAHGKEVMNFIISMFVFSMIGFATLCLGIGIVVLVLLGIFGVVCPIIGAVKASNGEVYRYPLTIQFLK